MTCRLSILHMCYRRVNGQKNYVVYVREDTHEEPIYVQPAHLTVRQYVYLYLLLYLYYYS